MTGVFVMSRPKPRWTLMLLWGVLLATPALAGTRRIAIVVGHNTGGSSRLPLRYAESDAGKMARVLTELGDVAPGDVYLLQGRRVKELEAVIDKVRRQTTEAHGALDRVVLYFYFSGHGEADALELGGERLFHEQLRGWLTRTGADLKVSIIDACRSGAAVRDKGAKAVPAFQVTLVDELRARGDVILTSSARDEQSLESSELSGGFFTSHFVTGLRGAADVSGDGRVTLAEAYVYAHDRTVTSTAATTGTAQHPSYEINLSGQGELVIAELRRATAQIVVPEGVQRALFREMVSEQLLADWVGGGASSRVAVPPGTYLVTVIAGGKSMGGRLRVEEGEERALRLEELREVLPVVTSARGEPQVAARPPVAARRSNRLELGALAGGGPGLGAEVRLGLERSSGHAITAAVVFGHHRYESYVGSSSVEIRSWTLGLRGGYRWLWAFDQFGAWAGAEAVAGVAFDTNVPYSRSGYLLTPLVGIGPRAGAFYEITPHLRLGAYGEFLFAAPYQQIGVGFHLSFAR